MPVKSPPRLYSALPLALFVSACDPAATGHAGAAAQASVDGPPGIEELEGATFYGLRSEPVTLSAGHWQGAPVSSGSASRPTAGLVDHFLLNGDVDSDGRAESAVLLWTSSGGSGTYHYLAVADRDETGRPVNTGTIALGDRVQLIDAAVSDGRIALTLIQAGPEDAACCPGRKLRRHFAVVDGELTVVNEEPLGRRSLADLSGVEWRLLEFSAMQPVPETVEVTLVVSGQRIAGTSGCNRYSGVVVEGDAPGELSVQPSLAVTRMACPPPADAVEARYLELLRGVTHYAFIGGRLALTWQHGEDVGTMRFERGPLSAEMAGGRPADPGHPTG